MATKVVGLEGGPAGGKTTAMHYITKLAQENDINAFTVPEVASEMLSGVDYQDISQDPARHLTFQTELLWQIVSRIENAKKIASKIGNNALVLADRVDTGAYLKPNEAKIIYQRLGFQNAPMHSMVDTIIYFPSIAHSDPAHYDRIARQTNSARYETADEARETCNKNRTSVMNHPDVWYMNEDNFDRKLSYAANIALMGLRNNYDGLAFSN